MVKTAKVYVMLILPRSKIKSASEIDQVFPGAALFSCCFGQSVQHDTEAGREDQPCCPLLGPKVEALLFWFCAKRLGSPAAKMP